MTDLDDILDQLDSLNQRMIRTESKLTALMHHFNLTAQGVPIAQPAHRYDQDHRRSPALLTESRVRTVGLGVSPALPPGTAQADSQ